MAQDIRKSDGSHWEAGVREGIVGTLRYDGQLIPFTDGTLMNLMVAATARLRRNEPFLLSWHEPEDAGLVRHAVWMHPGADLTWVFEGVDPDVDRAAVAAMVTAAGSGPGLIVIDGLGKTGVAPDRVHEVAIAAEAEAVSQPTGG